MVIRGLTGYRNKSHDRKLTLEKNIFPPLFSVIERANLPIMNPAFCQCLSPPFVYLFQRRPSRGELQCADQPVDSGRFLFHQQGVFLRQPLLLSLLYRLTGMALFCQRQTLTLTPTVTLTHVYCDVHRPIHKREGLR